MELVVRWEEKEVAGKRRRTPPPVRDSRRKGDPEYAAPEVLLVMVPLMLLARDCTHRNKGCPWVKMTWHTGGGSIAVVEVVCYKRLDGIHNPAGRLHTHKVDK